MGILHYKDPTTGQWVPLSAAGPTGAQGAVGPVGPAGPKGDPGTPLDEVWVGPEAPTDSSVEVWVDTDEVGSNDVLTRQVADATYVNVAGDTMTGNLTIQNRLAVQAGSTTNGGALIYLSPDAGKDASLVFQKAGDGYCGQIIYVATTDDLILRVWRNNNAEFTNALIIDRETGKVSTAAGDPVAPTGLATKSYVDNVGKWQAYTCTLNNITGTVQAARYCRIGNTVHMMVVFTLTGVLTHATPSITLPPGLPSQASWSGIPSPFYFVISSIPYMGFADLTSGVLRLRYIQQYQTNNHIGQSFNNWSGGVPANTVFYVSHTYETSAA
jgi:hypothetical protein